MGAFKGALIGLICHANRPHAPSCFWLGQEGGEEGRESNQGRCSLHFEKPVEGKEDATPSHVAADARRRHGGTPHAPPRHLELPYVVPTTGYRSLCLWHSLHRLASRGESLVLLLLRTKRERSKEEWGLFRVRGIASSSWWRRRQRGCELPTELRLHAWYNLCLEAAAFSRLPLLAWRWRLPVSDVDTKTATTTTWSKWQNHDDFAVSPLVSALCIWSLLPPSHDCLQDLLTIFVQVVLVVPPGDKWGTQK